MTHTRNAPASRKESLAPDLDRLEDRSVRAWTERMEVRRLPDGRYAVEGESGATYVVDVEERTCTCPDHAIRGERCKHIRRTAIEITRGRVPPPHGREADCAVCGAPLRGLDEDAPALCGACRPDLGEVALDRESGARLLVVGVTDRRADEVEVEGRGWTVADHPTNRGYDPTDPVIEALYVEDVRGDGAPRRYDFPVSRIERLAEATDG